MRGQAELVLADEVEDFILLFLRPRLQKLLQAPRPVHGKAEIGVLPDELSSLAQDALLHLGHLALIIGVTDVEVGVRDYKNRPLPGGLKGHVEIAGAARLDPQARAGCAPPLRHFEVGQLLAELVSGREIGRIVLAVQVKRRAHTRSSAVQPHDSFDPFRKPVPLLDVEDCRSHRGLDLIGQEFPHGVLRETQRVVEDAGDADAHRSIGAFRRGRVIHAGKNERVLSQLEKAGGNVDVELLKRIVRYEGHGKIAEIVAELRSKIKKAAMAVQLHAQIGPTRHVRQHGHPQRVEAARRPVQGEHHRERMLATARDSVRRARVKARPVPLPIALPHAIDRVRLYPRAGAETKTRSKFLRRLIEDAELPERFRLRIARRAYRQEGQ